MKFIFMGVFLIEFVVRPATTAPAPVGTTSIEVDKSYRRNIIRQQNLKLKKYKPNYGYEPYWPESEWVFSRHETTTPGQTVACTTVHCPVEYEKFGKMCARNVDFEHKTFDNYCDILNVNCEPMQKWFVAYRGNCTDELKTYPTKWDVLVTRAEEYLNRLNDTRTTAKRKP